MQADVHVVQSVHTNVNSFLVLIITSSYKLEHIKHSYPHFGHSLYCTQLPMYKFTVHPLSGPHVCVILSEAHYVYDVCQLSSNVCFIACMAWSRGSTLLYCDFIAPSHLHGEVL